MLGLSFRNKCLSFLFNGWWFGVHGLEFIFKDKDCFNFQGLRCRVHGLGFMVYGLCRMGLFLFYGWWFGVHGLGFIFEGQGLVQFSGFRVQGSWFRVHGLLVL